MGRPRLEQDRSTHDVFYTDTPVWKQQVVEQAHEAALQGCRVWRPEPAATLPLR